MTFKREKRAAASAVCTINLGFQTREEKKLRYISEKVEKRNRYWLFPTGGMEFLIEIHVVCRRAARSY